MRPDIKNSVLGWAFLAGLILVAADLILFLAGYRKAGLLFVSGMSVICGIALLSCIGNKQAKKEDWICMALGCAFFSWLTLKNL
jgi:hypothetical protein